jgi:hypothetical protein
MIDDGIYRFDLLLYFMIRFLRSQPIFPELLFFLVFSSFLLSLVFAVFYFRNDPFAHDLRASLSLR